MKRVEIYMGPFERKRRRDEVENSIGCAMREAGVNGSLVTGSTESEFDYAVEGLDRRQASRFAELVNKREGYCAKTIDWVP